MSGVANPYIDPNQHYEASVDKMLELLKGTDYEPASDDEEISDRTVDPTPVYYEVSDDTEDVLIRPRRTAHPINRLTNDRLGGVLKGAIES